jgi:hypothetical protein
VAFRQILGDLWPLGSQKASIGSSNGTSGFALLRQGSTMVQQWVVLHEMGKHEHLYCQTSALQLWLLVHLIARWLRHFDHKNSHAKRTVAFVALPKPSKTTKSPLHHLQGDASSLPLLPEPVKHVDHVVTFILGDRRL